MNIWTAELLVNHKNNTYSRHVGTLDAMIEINQLAIMGGREFPKYFLLGIFKTKEEASKRLDYFCKILDGKQAEENNP